MQATSYINLEKQYGANSAKLFLRKPLVECEIGLFESSKQLPRTKS